MAPKRGSLAIIALGKRPPGGAAPEDEQDGGADDGLEEAMSDLASAMREDDPSAMAEAFRAAMDIAR